MVQHIHIIHEVYPHVLQHEINRTELQLTSYAAFDAACKDILDSPISYARIWFCQVVAPTIDLRMVGLRRRITYNVAIPIAFPQVCWKTRHIMTPGTPSPRIHTWAKKCMCWKCQAIQQMPYELIISIL